MSEEKTRIAIVNQEKCKPKRCGLECRRYCPINRAGQQCVTVQNTSKFTEIAENLCTGCGACVRRCPHGAITIINLPSNLSSHTVHRFSKNSFKLHRLPSVRIGEVLGLVGCNGIGKTTALRVLSGKLRPNLGRFDDPPDWDEIIAHFRGKELQSYFTRILDNKIRPITKPQHVDGIPKAVRGKLGDVIERADERGVSEELLVNLQLDHLADREVVHLSGGELQRFAIAVASIRVADIYMFDEPSSYLDVKQRLQAAEVIRSLVNSNNYVVTVEHDLAVLDYLSDFVCCLYGNAGVYGVVTAPYSVREGINVFLSGYIPSDNMRFRAYPLQFRVSQTAVEEEALTLENADKTRYHGYPAFDKTLGDFHLHVEAGRYSASEIIGLIGENGTGKTTLIRLLAGLLQPDEDDNGTQVEMPELRISFKPQRIAPRFKGNVEQLLHQKIAAAMCNSQFSKDVLKPLMIDKLLDKEVLKLSGGELQRVAIALALGKPADVYLLDEPSAFLDVELRIAAGKAIRRFIINSKKTAFIVEHDFIMVTYMSDRVIVYDGEPGFDCTARSPSSLVSGMNYFLQMLDVTIRRDPENFRPRINKRGSRKYEEQRASGNYFFVDPNSRR
ncbi:hypothetical protein PCE1_001614 [Barthelona sp. PCE]